MRWIKDRDHPLERLEDLEPGTPFIYEGQLLIRGKQSQAKSNGFVAVFNPTNGDFEELPGFYHIRVRRDLVIAPLETVKEECR